MSIIENEKFELRQQARNVLPQVDKIYATAYYGLPQPIKDAVFSLDDLNLTKFTDELVSLMQAERRRTDVIDRFPETDEASFVVHDPEIAPDVVEFVFHYRKKGEKHRLPVRLVLRGYRLEFGRELGVGQYGGYAVNDLKIEESVTGDGRLVEIRYTKDKIQGFLEFEDPVIKNTCFNMLRARFQISSFEHDPC